MATTPKLTKDQVRSPDALQQNLTGTLEWVNKNAKLVFGIIIAALLVGGGLVVVRYRAAHTQMEFQEKFSLIERQLVDKKQGFEEAKRAASDPSKTKPDEKLSTKTPATGDLSKDYGSVVDDLESLVKQAPWTTAAAMAALQLADLRREYKQPAEALKTLESVNSQNDVSSLPFALVVSTKATLMADQGDCKSAVGLWEKITKSFAAGYMKDEAKLRMALCYESMNETGKAEQLYAELAKKDDKGGDREVARDAERYLRLLKFKKSTQGG